jgi:argininosuccinate synthase
VSEWSLFLFRGERDVILVATCLTDALAKETIKSVSNLPSTGLNQRSKSLHHGGYLVCLLSPCSFSHSPVFGDVEFYNRFPGRKALLDYAAKKQIPVQQTTAKPWSTDENLFHISYEAGILEDPDITPPVDMWKLTTAPENAPTTPEHLTIHFERGLPVKVDVKDSGETYSDPVEIFLALNALGRKHGVGRIDIVENRFIGVKSRGCYESPGATILRVAHIDLEGLTLDRNVRALRDQFVTVELSKILYNGHFFTPEREFVTSAIPASQRTVNGMVRLKLYKGNVVVEGRSSGEVRTSSSKACCYQRGNRVYMTNINLQWTNWVALSPQTRPALFRLNLSGSKSTSDTFALEHWLELDLLLSFRWAQANIRKGTAGVSPKDVYGTRV